MRRIGGVLGGCGATLLLLAASPVFAADPLRIELPQRASDPTTLGFARSALRVRLLDAVPQPTAQRGQLRFFADPLGPRTTLWIDSTRGFFEDFFLFAEPPPVESLRYELELAPGLALRLVEDTHTLEILDAQGAPRLRVEPPWVAALDPLGHPGLKRPARLRVEGCALDRSSTPPWGRPVTPPGAPRCLLIVDWSSLGVGYPLLVDPSWTPASSMAQEHSGHAEALLDDGRVLIAGGSSGDGSAGFQGPYLVELYDPPSDSWATVKPLLTLQESPGFRLVAAKGGALLVGGAVPLAKQAEWFDASSGAWNALPPPNSTHRYPAAARLPDGRILVAGGESAGKPSATVEIFDPTTLTWSLASPMLTARSEHCAVLLDDGRVLIAGGNVPKGASQEPTRKTELYDIASGSWSAGPFMVNARADLDAVKFSDGRVLLVGGKSATGWPKSSELFDPSTNEIALKASTNEAWLTPRVRLVGGDHVLLAGGFIDGQTLVSDKAELFSLQTGQWEPLPALPTPRHLHSLTSLGDGSVLLAGGVFNPEGVGYKKLASAERFRLLSLGESCSLGVECLSRSCVDGVCCESTCEQACHACSAKKKGLGSDGLCGPISLGLDPDLECPPNSPSSCLLLGGCDGSGSCSLHPSGTPCGPPSCLSPVPQVPRCNGSGSCLPLAEPCPDLFSCDPASASCWTSCSATQPCQPGAFCLAGQCLPQKAAGGLCGSAEQCQPGLFCVDGVCCTEACEQPCQACSAAKKGQGDDGVCGPVAVGTDPDEDCQPQGPCGNDGQCDGLGACRQVSAGTPCTAVVCEPVKQGQGWEEKQKGCDGKGACGQELASKNCGQFACKGDKSGCEESCQGESQCASGSYCEGGECKKKKGLGEGCAEGGECGSGECVDGVCCETKCDRNCEFCAGEEAGKCKPVGKGEEGKGGREKCGGEGECRGECDGESPVCQFAGGERGCGEGRCEEGKEGRKESRRKTCDGAGVCGREEKRDCGGYGCAGGECLETCEKAEECAEGFQCEKGKCEPRNQASCKADGYTRLAADGTETVCAPFRCLGGECLSVCSTRGDCTEKARCNSAGLCVTTDLESTDAGCAISPGSRPPTGALGFWFFCGLGGLTRIAGRRPRR